MRKMTTIKRARYRRVGRWTGKDGVRGHGPSFEAESFCKEMDNKDNKVMDWTVQGFDT